MIFKNNCFDQYNNHNKEQQKDLGQILSIYIKNIPYDLQIIFFKILC